MAGSAALALLLVAAGLLAVGTGFWSGLGSPPRPPARSVRVLPLFDAGGRILLLHRDEPGAAGEGAAIVVEWSAAGVAPSLPELVPLRGGPGVSGALLVDAAPGRVRVDLAPLAGGGAADLLPVRPPDRFFERPAPGDPARTEATAVYESDGFEGRVRLAAGGDKAISSSGEITAGLPADRSWMATLAWHDADLEVEPGAGVTAAWATPAPPTASAPGGPAPRLLYVLPPGALAAVGGYELRLGGDTLARIDLPEPPAHVVGGGARPGTILPSPIKRSQGTAAAPTLNTNNPLAYFDVLSGARANARGLRSADQLRQMAAGFLMYEQANGEFPDSLEQLSEVLGPMDALLNNLRTGDNPGFLYEKPRGGGPQEMVWESLGGEKDPTGAVLMSDGSIR